MGVRPRRTRMLPYEPLARLLVLAHEEQLSEPAAAILLGVAPRQINRWKHGGMTRDAADRMVTRLGLNGLAVWGEAWEAIWEPLPRARTLTSSRGS